jgi:long-chain acyl-CoA synthetase
MPDRTLKDLLKQNTHKFKDNLAFQIKRDLPAGRHGDKYVKYTYSDVGKYATGLIAKLKSLGIGKGDKVAILSENRPEWPISYLAVTGMGAVAVPLDSLGGEYDLKGIISHSEAKGIIVSDKFYDLIKNSPSLKFIISMDKDFESLSSEGGSASGGKDKASEDYGYDVIPEDLAAIVYTSGTTGIPKGVMLSHKNIMSNVMTGSALFEFGPKDMFLSVLPIHHMFESVAGFLAPFYCGARITYAESLKSFKLIQNMVETKTTIMIGVPMLYQLFYDGILREVEEKGPIFNFIFKTLMFISKAVKTLFMINIGRAFFGQVHKKLGGHIRFWVSGGAAIDPQLLKNFDLMGLTIIQGYGLTESSPVISANDLSHNKYGSVGRPIPDVCVKIVNGEIVASGPNIMQGYFKIREETEKVLKDSWLYTGDVGYIDKDGYLYITGRIKDVIVTSAGLNVYPDEVEFELNNIPYIKESCVIGRKRRGTEEVFAVVSPNMEYFEKMGLSIESNSIYNAIHEMVEKLNEKLPMHKRISGIEIRHTEFPKTSTRKIKRFVVRKEMERVWQS